MRSYRLFAFLAVALITFAFLIVMITNDLSVPSVTGATLNDARADTQPAGD
jgi:beta-lactam-binding protein with PASTA domain